MIHDNHTLFTETTFKTKDNRVIMASPHIATFKGSHNASKSKALLVLYHRRYNAAHDKGLSAIELHRQSGVAYGYLRIKLTLWCTWGYLKRDSSIINGRNVFIYSIDERGRRFVEDIIPAATRDKYVQQIKDFRVHKKICAELS